MSKIGIDTYPTLKDCMARHDSRCQPTESLIQRIKAFRTYWISRSQVHAEFLASNLTGCHPIRFSPEDELALYTEVFIMDKLQVKEDVYATKGIDPKMNIASNPTYHVLVYLMHRFYNSNLPEQKKLKAVEELYYITAYKMLGSLYSHYFSMKPVDYELAEAVMNNLSEKYLIRTQGSWQAVLEYRAKADVLKNSIFYSRIMRYNSTKDIIDTITGIQGRLRSLIKNIWTVMAQVLESNMKMSFTSHIGENLEGEEAIKDLTDRSDKYVVYIKSIIQTPNDMLVDDLVELTARLVGNIKIEKLKSFVVFVSQHTDRYDLDMPSVVIIETIGYLRTKGIISNYRENMIYIIKMMRGFWSTTGGRSKDIKRVKEITMRMVSEHTGDNVGHVVKSMTAGYLIYVFLRSFYIRKD